MISDNYMDETAEMLQNAAYIPSYVSEIQEGSEIAIMHKDFTDGEKDIVEFFSVQPGIRKDQLSNEHGLMDSYVLSFIVKNERGILKHQSYNGSWGIYIRRKLELQPFSWELNQYSLDETIGKDE